MAYLNLNTHSVTKAISLPHQHVTLKKFANCISITQIVM